jgi:hypothetical protein
MSGLWHIAPRIASYFLRQLCASKKIHKCSSDGVSCSHDTSTGTHRAADQQWLDCCGNQQGVEMFAQHALQSAQRGRHHAHEDQGNPGCAWLPASSAGNYEGIIMMGDDVNHDAWECEVHRAAELRAQVCESRGLTPSQACSVGCATCGVIDASPARCEQCNGLHAAGRPFTGRAPGMLQDDDKGLSKWLSNRPNAKHIAREAAAMIGRGHIAAETPDTEGGAE